MVVSLAVVAYTMNMFQCDDAYPKNINVKDSVGMLRENGGIHFPFIAGAQSLLLKCELCGLCEKW